MWHRTLAEHLRFVGVTANFIIRNIFKLLWPIRLPSVDLEESFGEAEEILKI